MLDLKIKYKSRMFSKAWQFLAFLFPLFLIKYKYRFYGFTSQNVKKCKHTYSVPQSKYHWKSLSYSVRISVAMYVPKFWLKVAQTVQLRKTKSLTLKQWYLLIIKTEMKCQIIIILIKQNGIILKKRNVHSFFLTDVTNKREK